MESMGLCLNTIIFSFRKKYLITKLAYSSRIID